MSFYDFHELRTQEDMQLLKLQFNENVLPRRLNDLLFLSHNRFGCSVDDNEMALIVKLFDILK
ncbi:MAG: hypothetical protein IJY79_02095 [Clostridia bacterium]|nr:hypothetical protein [Clostridia bacterium]